MCWGCNGAGHLRSGCPRINKEDCNIKCWGCDGTGHARSNCPQINQEYLHRACVIESKKVCSHRKGSDDENIESPSRRPCPENNKYTAGKKKRN
ncbi:hypothetical protein TNCV_113601 [Trichonephila clavipes]|nr:hypothetical protein TNCV_113601 [Trichonephila clavipes]